MWPVWETGPVYVTVAGGLISRCIVPDKSPLWNCEAFLALYLFMSSVTSHLPLSFSSCLIRPAHKHPGYSSLPVGLSSEGQVNKYGPVSLGILKVFSSTSCQKPCIGFCFLPVAMSMGELRSCLGEQRSLWVLLWKQRQPLQLTVSMV